MPRTIQRITTAEVRSARASSEAPALPDMDYQRALDRIKNLEDRLEFFASMVTRQNNAILARLEEIHPTLFRSTTPSSGSSPRGTDTSWMPPVQPPTTLRKIRRIGEPSDVR